MSFTSGPIPVSLTGQPLTVQNPAQGSGNLSSIAAVVVNLSPYELVVKSGAGTLGVIDPYTRDLIPLDPVSQQLEIDTLSIGGQPYPGTTPELFIMWYQNGESIPGNYPTPIALPNAAISGALTNGMYEAIPAGGLLFDLTNTPATFRSILLAFAGDLFGTVYPPGQLFIAVTTPGSGTGVQSYFMELVGNGTGHIRIPLAPANATTMGIKVGITYNGGGAAGQAVFAELDTVEVEDPSPTVWGDQFYYPGFFNSGAVDGRAPIPKVPTVAVNTATSLVINPPLSGGANYFFGADLTSTSGAQTGVLLDNVTGQVLASLSVTATGGTDHVNLDAYRTADAVVAETSTASATIVVRYARGP